MSIRRLRVLIDHLPPESFTKVAIRNSLPTEELEKASEGARPDKAPWSGTEMLLASVLDAIRQGNAIAVAAAGGKPAEVKPTPRPGILPESSSRPRLTDEQRRLLDPRLRNAQPKEA
jgi:hypothetical protein